MQWCCVRQPGAFIDWGHYLFSFSGRINRAKAWLFILMAIVFEFIFIAAITAAFGLGTIANFAHNKLPPSALTGNAVAIALCGFSFSALFRLP